VTITRIKICGITRPEDARLVAMHGADAIGLVFYAASPRAVTVEQAVRIAEAVPPFVTVVALFVDEPAENIRRIIDSVPVDLIQFHGNESPEFCRQFARPWIKAVRVKPSVDLVAACRDYSSARGVLLDSWVEGVPGGTGKTFDWQLAAQQLSLPLVVAGGLDDRNVGTAIARLRPAAVDVSGGVELAPGIKDPEKITRFIAAVRVADGLLDGTTDDK
jgi:phosphoribosylanthranilate isomerase